MEAAVAYRTDLPSSRRAASILAMAPDSRTDVELLRLIAEGDRPAFEDPRMFEAQAFPRRSVSQLAKHLQGGVFA